MTRFVERTRLCAFTLARGSFPDAHIVLGSKVAKWKTPKVIRHGHDTRVAQRSKVEEVRRWVHKRRKAPVPRLLQRLQPLARGSVPDVNGAVGVVINTRFVA